MNGYLKFYKDLPVIVRIILAIIPFTGWLNAVLYRVASGHVVAGIVAIFLGPLFWLVDLVCVILSGKPTLFA